MSREEIGTKIVAVAVTKEVGNGEYLTFTLPAPARHHDVLQAMARLGMTQDAYVEQGFLTDTGRFVRRKPAKYIAEQAGQMKPRLPGQYDGPELFSEDLW